MTEGALTIYRKFVRKFAEQYAEVLVNIHEEYIKPFEKKSDSSDKYKATPEISIPEVKKTNIMPKVDQVSVDDIKLEEKTEASSK